MKKDVKIAIGAISLLAAVLCILVILPRVRLTNVDCQTLAANTPEPPPVYPGSVLLEREALADDEWLFWYELHYETSAKLDMVKEFYERSLTDGCLDFRESRGFNTVSCSGDAEPVGGYGVVIDYRNPESTTYDIPVTVDRCSQGF